MPACGSSGLGLLGLLRIEESDWNVRNFAYKAEPFNLQKSRQGGTTLFWDTAIWLERRTLDPNLGQHRALTFRD